VMQLNQCRQRHARRAKPHPGAGGGIQDPRRSHDDYAGRRLEVDNSAGFTLFAALAPDAVAIQGVPAIMDLDLLPDMGRMTRRLLSIVRTRCSPATTSVPRTGRCSPL
jgi:hypothetical protein